MSREAIIKATASALQPDSLDLTQFAKARVASYERELRVRSDIAAGALAFAAMDQFRDINGKGVAPDDAAGTRFLGDPFPPMLLRLKYADQSSRELLARAHAILLHRHGGFDRRGSDTLNAVAMAALVEWVHDACTSCRGQGCGVTVRVCTVCPKEPELPDGRVFRTAQPGCPQCKGMGRIFERPKPSKGIKCLACHGKGWRDLAPRRRAAMVSDLLRKHRRKMGQAAEGLHAQVFHSGGWSRIYHGFLDVLRAADKTLVAHVDLRAQPSFNRGSVVAATLEEQEDHGGDAPVGSPTADELSVAEPQLPPKDS